MAFPKKFYFSQTKEGLHYGKTPSGSLSVTRLIRGLPYWTRPSAPRDEQKKHLIIAEPELASLSEERKRQVALYIAQLIEAGFSISLATSDGLRALVSPEIEPLMEEFTSYPCMEMTADDYNNAIKKDKRLTRDSTLIINESDFPRMISMHDYTSLNYEEREQYLESLRTAQPPVTGIMLDVLWIDGNVRCQQEISALQAVFKDIPVYKDYQYIECTNSKALDNLDLLSIDLSHVKKISMSQMDIDSEKLKSLLELTPHVKEIELTACELSKSTFELEEFCLAELEVLNLSNSHVSSQIVSGFIQDSYNLKSLDLSMCKGIRGHDYDPLPTKLTRLEASHLSAPKFSEYLQASSNLKEVHLYDCADMDQSIGSELKGKKFEALRDLTLQRVNISSQNLDCFLEAMPNLKVLNLSINKCDGQPLKLNPFQLYTLEDLTLNNISFHHGNLDGILKAAPRIKKLNLSYCKNQTLTLRHGTLNNLETLILSNNRFSGEDLTLLLQSAPNLKTLDLSDQDLSSYVPLSLPEGCLSKLETISLPEMGYISLDNLYVLLRAASNLTPSSRQQIEDMISSKEQSERLGKEKAKLKKEDDRRMMTEHKDVDLSDVPTAPSTTPSSMPKHNPKDLKVHLPNTDFNLSSKPVMSGLNQGMLIDKFSRYLTSVNADATIISLIKNGMCYWLSQYASTMKTDQWHAFLIEARDWDGVGVIPGKLNDQFNNLLENIKTKHQSRESTAFLGEKAQSFLFSTGGSGPFIISNPVHAILVRRESGDRWSVYDPNCNQGSLSKTSAELLPYLHETMGYLLAVESATASVIECEIVDEVSFIAHGGLLTLVGSANTQSLISRLTGASYTLEALDDGLFARSVDGVPAWWYGLNSRNQAIRELTKMLINDFGLKSREDVQKRLEDSLKGVTLPKRSIASSDSDATPASESKEEPIDADNITLPDDTSAIPPHDAVEEEPLAIDETTPVSEPTTMPASEAPEVLLYEATSAPDSLESRDEMEAAFESYKIQLSTWDKDCTAASSPDQYYQRLMQANKQIKTRLIELNSSEALDALGMKLEDYAKRSRKPVFYINSPDDLICMAAFIQKNADKSGTLHKGPGGPLYDFLQQYKDEKPTLIVNYEAFHADDIVRFNGLLDKMPHADGIPLPPDTRVIGLLNLNHPDCYDGSDFYSRFDIVERCPLEFDVMQDQSLFIEATLAEDPVIIELFHAADWDERLFGRWLLNGNQLVFQEGLLDEAIKTNRPIQIKHGLWDSEAFVRKINRALSPKNIQLITPPENEPYDWDYLRGFKPTITDRTLLLNPTHLSSFFEQNKVRRGRLIRQPGLLEQAKRDGILAIKLDITRPCDEHQLAMILNRCKELDLAVYIQPSPGVSLPWETSIPANHRPAIFSQTPLLGDAVITTNDMDVTLENINAKGDYHVIDISECEASDLFTQVSGALNERTLRFEFSEKAAAIVKLLAQNKKVILKGAFSDTLSDELTLILHNRRDLLNQGQLLVVTAVGEPFSHHPTQWQHNVTVEDKNRLVGNDLNPNESLAHRQARKRLQGKDPWVGMRTLTPTAMSDKFDITQSKTNAAAFHAARKNAVDEVLADSPYVFITGLTGVGKSTFVDKTLKNAPNTHFFHGEVNLTKWALDKSKKQKILFIDEANMSTRQWSEFEGLFNTPPTILIQGKLHKLTAEHKVVFAGNPVSYGDERTLAPLFERHGGAVLFEPLSLDVVYEDVIKPISANQTIAEPILAVYQFLSQFATTDVLITPRELQMMALLTVSYVARHPEQDIKQIAQHYSYHLAKNLVPTENQDDFDERFKPAIALVQDDVVGACDYLITPTRQAIAQQLLDCLHLREFKRHPTENEVLQYGGLGGLTIEGEPGIGKSELVIQILRNEGYQEQKFHSQSQSVLRLFKQVVADFCALLCGCFTLPADQKHFYRMPVSMAPEEKEALLLQAFHEGAVVIVDEINSSPMMERLLNALLMGKTLNNERPLKPGFFIIGTQNPVTMAGRRAASSALMHRTTTSTLTEYNAVEMTDILVQKGVKQDEAECMVSAYQSQREHALLNQLSPTPCFRDLLRVAKYAVSPQLKHDDKFFNDFVDAFQGVFKESNSSGIRDMMLQLQTLLDDKHLTSTAKIAQAQTFMQVIAQQRLAKRTMFFSPFGKGRSADADSLYQSCSSGDALSVIMNTLLLPKMTPKVSDDEDDESVATP